MDQCFFRLDRAHQSKRGSRSLLVFMLQSKLPKNDLRTVYVFLCNCTTGYHLLLAVKESLGT